MKSAIRRPVIISASKKTSPFCNQLKALPDDSFFTINDLPMDLIPQNVCLSTRILSCITTDKRFEALSNAVEAKQKNLPNHLNKLRSSIHFLRLLPTCFKVNIEEEYVDSGDEKIRLQIYFPCEKRENMPILLYIHGGGFVFGNELVGDSYCRKLAYHNSAIVVSVNYRLAPEYTFPIPLEDCYAALCYCAQNAERLGGSADHIYVSGDSAGGNLSSAVHLYSLERSGPKIKGLILIYPALDFTRTDMTTMSRYEKGYGLTLKCAVACAYAYVNGDESLAYNLHVSPILASTDSFPPSLVISAQYDILRHDALRFSQNLKASNQKVRYVCMQGTFHGFISFEYSHVFGHATDNAIAFIDRNSSII